MTVFIVSSDDAVRDSLTMLVTAAGLCPRALPALDAWIEVAGPEPRGCLVLDAGVNDLAGPERLARFASVCARIPVVVLTGRGDITTAVHAIRQGAVHVQQKPYRDKTLLEYIKQAVATQYDRSVTG
jgi:two-component system response regulator DctR